MGTAYDSDELNRSEQSAGDSINPADYGQMSFADEKGGKNFENRVGRGYVPDNPSRLSGMKPSGRGVFSFAKANRRKLIISGTAAGFVTLLIVGFFFLIPFKILHIVNNLQSRFYATAENAVQKETDVLFSQYIKKYVIPGLNNCRGSTIDRNCTPKDIQGNSIVSQLYQGWKTARFENKLAEKYGLEFKKVGSNFYMKMPGMTGNGANINDFVNPNQLQLFSLDEYIENSNDPQFKRVSRTELRREYRQALDGETRWKQVMYRFKIGGYLERKYGLKRCIIVCDSRLQQKLDNFADWKDDKKRAAKLILAERVLAPRSEVLALVVQCVIVADDSCQPNRRDETDSDGRKQSKIQADIQGKLAELRLLNDGRYASVIANSEGILKDGYKRYVTKKIAGAIVGKFGGEVRQEATEKIAGNMIPVIGWINTASSTIGALDNAPGKVRALSYMTNAAAMVSLYSTYRTYADEIKNGNVDAEIVGSFTDALGPGDKNSTGGSAGAENTPLYSYIMGSGSQSAPFTFDGLVNQRAFAASDSAQYICDNGKPVPAGQLVCQEEVLGGGNGVLNSIEDALDKLGPLTSLADFWNSTLGIPFRAAAKITTYITSSILQRLPYYDRFQNKITEAAEPIIKAFTDYLIPSPFSDNMGGGRILDMMAGGADVSGNDYCQNGLGCRKVSDEQASAIFAEQQQQELDNYKKQPFLARIFDVESRYSPMAKLALAMPSNANSARTSVLALLSNPFAKISQVFTSPFSFSQVGAAAPISDPFGITQYAYPANDPDLIEANKDPEAFWLKNCSSDGMTLDWSRPYNQRWQNNTSENTETGLLDNTTTNPCLLIQATLGSAGAIFDEKLLSPEELEGTQGENATETAGSQIVGDIGENSDKLACAPGTKDVGVATTKYTGEFKKSAGSLIIRLCQVPSISGFGDNSSGATISGGAVVNSRVSGAWLALGQAAKTAGVSLSSNSSFRLEDSGRDCDGIKCALPGRSAHQFGVAIDFADIRGFDPAAQSCATRTSDRGNPKWEWLYKNAEKFGFKQYSAEAWHFDPLPMSNRCGFGQ